MRHTQRSDARDNRARILAAARLAVATGDPDVPVREIARRAEVGAATVYRHFPTKEALFAEALAGATPLCSTIVEEGLAAEDPWRGFCLVIERSMELYALDRDVSGAVTSRLPAVAEHAAADRERALRLLLRLVARAKESGDLRADLVVEDLVLAMMANRGIHTGPPATRVAASRRFAALMTRSFRAEQHPEPHPEPLPPAVRLPLP